MSLEKAVAEDCFRRIIVGLVIQTVHTAEVRNIAFGAYACTAEKDDFSCVVYDGLEFLHGISSF